MIRAILTYLVLAVAISVLYLGGALEPVEQRILEWRYRLTDRDPGAGLLIVTIDSRSLGEIGVWPWSRQLHAEVIDRLVSAGAYRIALGVDFSSASDTAADARMEQSLARAGKRVILPGFVQRRESGSGTSGMIFTAPLARFARYTAIASTNLPADRDGTVRRNLREVPWIDGTLPTLATALVRPGTGVPETYYIDFGINAAAIKRVSFIDILEGRFDRTDIAGRTVLVGADAGELGDVFQTPRFGLLPGAVIHALATETLMQGRALWRVPAAAVMAGIFAIVFLLARFSTERTWRRGLTATVVVAGATLTLAVAIQFITPLIFDVVPWIVTAVLSYGLGLAHTASAQDLRLLAQRLAIRRKDIYVRKLVDAAFDGIVTVDESGVVRSANPQAVQMFGSAQESMIGEPVEILFERDHAADGIDVSFLSTAAEDGIPREIRGRHKNGESFEASLAVTRVPDEDHTLFVLLVLDVSARRRAEAEAADTRQRLADALESISDGIVLWSPEDRLSTCNSRFIEFHGPVAHILSPGCRFEDFVGQLAMMGACPDADGRESEWIRERVARHRDPAGGFIQQTADGRWLRVVERRTAEGGIIGVEADVTDDFLHAAQLNRAREAAEAASLAKTRFLANMSHELRTPLNAILGFSEVIRDSSPDALEAGKYQSYARDIHSSGRELLEMVNDILEIARIEVGASDLSEDIVDVEVLVADAIRTLAGPAERARVRLSVEPVKNLPDFRADRRRMRQSLISVIGLAIRHSPPEAEIGLRMGIDGTGGLRISVTDRGKGLGQDTIARALDPFGPIRSDISVAQPAGGLVLSVANMRLRQHGGRLEIADHPDGGTTTTLCIPPERMVTGLAESPSPKLA